MGQKKSKIVRAPDFSDLVRCTQYTASEITEWYESFMRDCPTGMLSLTEFQNLYAEVFPSVDSSGYAERIFRSFDTSGDGIMDFREFMCALSITCRGTFEERVHWTFSMYDLDNDGSVTLSELEDMMKNIYSLLGEDLVAKALTDRLTAKQRARGIFDVMDKNMDGKVSYREYYRVATSDPDIVLLLKATSNGPCRIPSVDEEEEEEE